MTGLQKIRFITYTLAKTAELNAIFTNVIKGEIHETIGRIQYNTLKDKVAIDIFEKDDLPIEDVYKEYFVDHDFEYYMNEYRNNNK